jgi:hypothetical protein
MAFVTGAPLPVRASRAAPTCARAPTMSGGVSRRGLVRGAALGLAALGAQAALAAGGISLKELKGELKEDVEEMKYDEELFDVGPDSKEANRIDLKRPPKVNTAVVAEEEREEKEEEKYDAMVAREKEEAARIKAVFDK